MKKKYKKNHNHYYKLSFLSKKIKTKKLNFKIINVVILNLNYKFSTNNKILIKE